MASNESGLRDEDGEFSDWIEIHNPGAAPVNLGGYHLTDNPLNLDKWTFPPTTLEPGGYMVVFASGKDRLTLPGALHTDFSLSSEGEYLALVAPDGATVISSFGSGFPEQFENESFGLEPGLAPTVWMYFTAPTPGAANSAAGPRVGPIFDNVVKNPPQPSGGPMVLTATLRQANGPVASARLYYRRMFNAEVSAPMNDNGEDGDAIAGDGVWSATIPASAFVPGEMTRWRYSATDSAGTETKEPPYRKPLDSHQYYGTVTMDDRIETRLTVVHWFTSNPNGAGTTTGSRGAVYYGGEFYDNVLFNVHGQSTAGFPKKSYNIDFNRTQRFLWNTNAPRVADIDLITNWADKSKVRHVLAYEVMRESGVAAHFAFTVRVQQNGNFFSTADFIEDADEIYLERAGLNPEGALYKVYNNTLNRDAGNTANSGVEKKTRRGENNTDLQNLINGLDLTGTALANYIRDNIDIPRCVSMLAANSVIRNIDMHSKNWYIYRDTGRSDEWAILPWDLDLSHGRVWNQQNTYFDNGIYTDGFVVSGTSIRLVAHLFADPAIRAMILRRIRTLSDEFLQPPPAPGTPESELYYERRLNEQAALIDPPGIIPSDARRDFEKWGSWLQGGTVVSHTSSNPAAETMAEAIARWKNEYLPRRRAYIYNTQVVGSGGQIPLPQAEGSGYTYTHLVSAGAPAKALVPVNGDLGVKWIGLSSNEPFDDSGWVSGTTGVGYDLGTGYEEMIGLDLEQQMKSNASVHIRIEFNVENPAAFERLELRMKFDDGFVAFLNGAVLVSSNSPGGVQWNSLATTSREASASRFDVFDVTSKMGSLRAGRNVLAIHGLNDDRGGVDMLILPELVGAKSGGAVAPQPKINFGVIEPSPASGNQDQEYIQLLNPHSFAVDISEWRLAGGVEHTFAPGTVIPANGALYVCPDAAAFRARTVSPKRGEGLFIQGGYRGHLSSLGETITLLDSSNQTNNSAVYQGNPSDAQRYLAISEVMYHPPGDGLAEFIEVLNTSSSVTLNLSNIRFTRGVDFNFTGSAITNLPPGARALIVRDLAAFTAVYGTNHPVAGVFSGDSALSNSGEILKLEDADDQTIKEFYYDDDTPWPAGADGDGYSMALKSPETSPDPALAASWRASAMPGGSPGSSDGLPLPANPGGDADGNGEADLIDYALGNDLGLDPLLPSFSWPTPESLQLVSPISVGADRVALDFLFSTDLVSWLPANGELTPLSFRLLGDGRAMVTWAVRPPSGSDGQLYLRMRATPR